MPILVHGGLRDSRLRGPRNRRPGARVVLSAGPVPAAGADRVAGGLADRGGSGRHGLAVGRRRVVRCCSRGHPLISLREAPGAVPLWWPGVAWRRRSWRGRRRSCGIRSGCRGCASSPSSCSSRRRTRSRRSWSRTLQRNRGSWWPARRLHRDGVGTAALLGVHRARRGETPDWRYLLAPIHALLRRLSGPRTAFASANRAQFWMERRLSGYSLPFMMVLVTPFLLWPLFFLSNSRIDPLQRRQVFSEAVPSAVQPVARC